MGEGAREEQWEGREDLWRGAREEGNNGRSRLGSESCMNNVSLIGLC